MLKIIDKAARAVDRATRGPTVKRIARLDVIEARIRALGLELPAALNLSTPARLPFQDIQVIGRRVLFSGHAPLSPDGSLAAPLGKLGAQVSVEEGYRAAQLVTLAILASIKRRIGSLDRVSAWRRVFGMVNSAAGFDRQPEVINGCSDLIVEIFGHERGAHTRSAIGVAELPFGIPVEIEGELEIDGGPGPAGNRAGMQTEESP